MPSDIVFPCAKCRQWLEAPPEMTGLFVECPTCQAIIKVPAESVAAPSAPPAATPVPPPVDPKGSTMRIQLPPNLGIPEPPRRRFVIRRGPGA